MSVYVKRRPFRKRPKDIPVVLEEPIKRGTSECITHTTLHHGADILELTVRTLLVGDGFLCTKRTFDAIGGRLKEYFQLDRTKKFKSKEWSGIWHVKRLA